MKQRLLKIAKFALYPLFYLFCLVVFGYLSFPYDQLKDRIIAEFDRMQAKSARRGASSAGVMRLEIDELDSYWVTGVEVTGARLIVPPKVDKKKALPFGGSKAKKADEKPALPSKLIVDRVVARVQILPLLIGNVRINFSAEAFGGTIDGSAPLGAGGGEVEVEFASLNLRDIGPLQQMLQGIPLSGLATGALTLAPKDGKFRKADGTLNAQIDAVKIGGKRKGEDGKTEDVMELQGVALPSVSLGNLIIEASAKDGLLTIDDFGTKGRDFELFGEGKVRLHESWDRAKADLYLKFKFTDSYREKSDAAASLLGKPGDKFEPAIEIAPRSPFKRAKTDDGYYRFHVSGPLGKIDYKPAGAKSARGPKKPASKRAKASKKASPLRLTKPPTRKVKPKPEKNDEEKGEEEKPEEKREEAEDGGEEREER
jgi:type II secretion system protein N